MTRPASKITTFTSETKKLLTPARPYQRVDGGWPPIYVVKRPDYDRLPIDTFLVSTELGTMGRVPLRVLRVVKPHYPRNYPKAKLTPEGRLLYVCWRGGMAVKSLEDVRPESYRHVVLPGEPGHDLIDAFKIACDARRGFAGRPMAMKPDLLLRALGIEES